MTEEEQRLNRFAELREQVNNALRCFDPIEIDTSHLNAEEVLQEVIYWLLKAGILIEGNQKKTLPALQTPVFRPS